MCSNQKPFFVALNAQISLVHHLSADLKKDLSSIAVLNSSSQKIKRVCPNVLQIITGINHLLGEIEVFGTCNFYPEEETLNDIELLKDWEMRFSKKTFKEILGIEETNFEDSWAETEMDCEESLLEESEQSHLNCETSPRGPYRSYKTSEKLNVVKLHKEGKSYAWISKTLKIPQKNIVRWCKNGVYRKEGAGRKIGDELMEKKVVEWMQKQYFEGQDVTGKDIRMKAMEFSSKSEFKSSKGWLKNFMKRQENLVRYMKVEMGQN